MNADNQQERSLIDENQKWFLAGFVEGEGSVCVSLKKHKNGKFGYLIDPEFFLYQHKLRKGILELAQRVFGTGRIYPKADNSSVLVFAIDARKSLLEKVVPFFNKYMRYSSRAGDLNKFERIIRDLEKKKHWTKDGMIEIVRLAYSMNMDGKQRRRDINEVINEILRD
jgi:LAGLIDADG endonuclease